MTRSIRPACLLSLSLGLLLTACGGGGDGSPAGTAAPQSGTAGTVDTLVGTWQACTKLANGSSWLGVYTLEKKSATQATYTSRKETFATDNCVGNHIGLMERGGTITWDGGSKSVDAVDAAKVTFTPTQFHLSGSFTFVGSPTQSYKQVLALTDATTLREGDVATAESDGYPAHLLDAVYVKR